MWLIYTFYVFACITELLHAAEDVGEHLRDAIEGGLVEGVWVNAFGIVRGVIEREAECVGLLVVDLYKQAVGVSYFSHVVLGLVPQPRMAGNGG